MIRLTKAHQAKVEEKPEVRKAGGLYYTPAYIVDYIVKHTVGQLLDGKTPKQAAKLRILDPACGSGSFLLGAYRYLLDWHRDRYLEDSTLANAGLERAPGSRARRRLGRRADQSDAARRFKPAPHAAPRRYLRRGGAQRGRQAAQPPA